MSIDPNRPSSARVYDVFLGGTHNFAVDRSVAARIMEIVPEMTALARANRAFLHRVVRWALAHGIRQFIDLGSGIPTEGNVHEVALAADPAARVVYVDVDPTAVLYAHRLLGDDPRTVVVQGDLRDPASVLSDPALRSVIDLGRPVGILMFAVLHFVPDGPVLDATLRGYREAVAPGSLLALSHASGGLDPEAMTRVADLYSRTGTPFVPRGEERFTALFEGWELIEPGVVRGPGWHPAGPAEPISDPGASLMLAGVGRRGSARVPPGIT
ncbi:SAM-dependent methyltransferase [Actinoplanes sp. L3-i22]|uniref:SAM-dependent methyltransferase n=1 Tax=Actinoplanes sp. L3-i22 TaxID=2836373 RepID=UPI001C863727|nr:SAM-dependent methyltransferase [Actinoplanes sp. L3-i22]